MADAPPNRSTKPHSDEIRAAVMAALLAGQGVNETAVQYNVPVGTVKTWRARMDGRSNPGALAKSDKREKIGELLVDYLASTLRTLKKQQVVFSDPKWLREQNSADLAVLHGVLTDKAIRLLEALGGAGAAATTDEPPAETPATDAG